MSTKTKHACSSCRSMKRKCDGQHPCSNCVKTDQDCVYNKPSRKRRRSITAPTEQARDDLQTGPAVLRTGVLAEINSGAILAKGLGLSSSSSSIERPRLCSWNLSLRDNTIGCYAEAPLTQVLSISQVHPVYNFLDRAMVERAILSMSPDQPLFDPAHHVLLGIAAVACLFSDQPVDLEPRIVQYARGALEHSTTLQLPTVDHIVGWLLRVIYLRLTGSPNATWIASCTLMHMIETARLHLEPSNVCVPSSGDSSYSPQLKKRIYYIAQLFNTWISYDYGRCRIIPRGASCSLPAEDWTADDIAIWRLTDSLDPDRNLDSTDLENLLLQASELTLSHPALELKRCNIALCIYRRLRVSGRVVSNTGIDKATEMARRHSPWWHIVNVPFQTICVLLAIDTRASLERVGKSLSSLRLIAGIYGTSAINETFVAARSLIRIHMKRKKEDYEKINSST
ncbi:hypothetical protein BDV37DRAFT_290302 [Aspergillus pseudonomiae]|uniref:Zn(2)-C6 fungal-type domain-containing protein n=1 Tax=Aspergillus pseudonomiae TaxID=1506151 RepID=A0A5N7DML8_9EURO|nr:uncharacterized protein BDV37DRAFT_290302 [Aspergillus pseudonomiae]KAE8407565.1 hypothetical protein BDV37DRAFT_290302 [Aspergillus pseudonomiae]